MKISTRLNLLVEDLLILARLESRSIQLKVEPIVATELFRQIAGDWSLRAQEKKVEISINIADEVSCFKADRFRLEQVLNNLIDNALKYSGRDGRVTLSARHVGTELELSVADNGPGMSPEDLPHIFERFYRVDKARAREQGGTGLGLSIVKHIVQLHGGSVDAESTVGEGTRMIVRLPPQREH